MLNLTVKMDLRVLQNLITALQPERIDPVVERVALKALRQVVEATPKRWFGQVRRDWRIERPRPGARVLANPNKIMWWLEHGTRAHGPVRAKALFIALTRRAALRQPGLVFGQDYVLAKRVRGIEPRRIAAKQAERTQRDLLMAFREHVRAAIRAGKR